MLEQSPSLSLCSWRNESLCHLKKKKKERKKNGRAEALQDKLKLPESWVLCGCHGNRPFSCGPTCSGFEERKLPPVSAFAVCLPPGHHLPLSSQLGIIPSEIHINGATHNGGIYCTLAKTLHIIIFYLHFDITPTEFNFLYKMPCGYTRRHIVLTVI